MSANFLKWTQDRWTKYWKRNDFGFCYAKCASQIRSCYECAKHCEQQKWSNGKIQSNKGGRTWPVACETRINREGTAPEKTKQTAFYFYCEAVIWRIAQSSECVQCLMHIAFAFRKDQRLVLEHQELPPKAMKQIIPGNCPISSKTH